MAIARFLYFRKEKVQFDKIEMLDLISAAFDELARRHKRRNVSAHSHPMGVRAIGNDRDQLRFDGGINLHLDITMPGVPIDVTDRFLGSLDPHLGGPGKLAGAVDDARFQNPRPKLRTVVVARDALQKSVGIIAHVARAGHAIGKIERATFGTAKMLVIVPQPRHQEATGRR